MRRRDWFWVIGVIFVIWGVDAYTKQWALDHIRGLHFWGPFGIVLHHNPGAMLGIFADLPPILRVVSLSTGGAFLLFIYGFIQYLLPNRSFVLRMGMSILLGGILGNVTDRILWGAVVDFLLLGSPQRATPAFNIADAVQWVGYFMIVGTLIKNGNQFWPESNIRKQFWVNPKFQKKYILTFMSIGAGFAVITGVFSYTYLRVTIESLMVGKSAAAEAKFLTPFLITHFVVTACFAIALFVIGRRLSHRIAGPLYAFEKFLDEVIEGKSNRTLKLRAGDEFSQLEDLSVKLKDELLKVSAMLEEQQLQDPKENDEESLQQVLPLSEEESA